MAREVTSLAERIWSKVLIGDGCWLWIASTTGSGYGQIWRGEGKVRNELAHRAMWIVVFGEIPEGLEVLHDCDNKVCVRPSHLFLGTQLDNVQDMDAKGRRARIGTPGESHWKAKLTEDQVREIRSSTKKPKELCSLYGISKATVHRIWSGKGWACVG